MTASATAAGLTFDVPQMKEVVGHFATGVVIVTGFDGAEPLGFTCQSFVSLSLDPPLIGLSPSRSSSTWPRLRELGRFCVNVLSEDQQALSTRFARSGGDKFGSVGWRAAPSGAPLLDGVCAWVDCRVWSEYDSGDHTFVVGEVLDLGTRPNRRPLVFHRGAYGLRRVAVRNPLLPDETDIGWDW